MPVTDRTEDYPLPWRKRESRSGITIRDANGMRVLFIPFTGTTSMDAKRRVAHRILEAVNGDKRDPALTYNGSIPLHL